MLYILSDDGYNIAGKLQRLQGSYKKIKKTLYLSYVRTHVT